MHLDEALFRLTKRPIESAERLSEGIVLLVFGFKLPWILADVGYLWVGVSRPW